MKFYNVEIFNKKLKDAICKYLKANKIYYELSGCDGWHFEILTDATGSTKLNNFIDTFEEVVA